MKNINLLSLSLLLVVISFNFSIAQTHYSPKGDFTSAMNINPVEAKVNGINLIAGDEIGIFDGDLCVGTIVLVEDLGELTDKKFIGGQAGADDTETEEIDGFTPGDTISFKIWDTSENEEIDNIVITFYDNQLNAISPAPRFEIGNSVFVQLLATHNYTPKANAGSNQNIDEKTQGQLDGSCSSDLEGHALSYSWQDIDNLGLNSTTIVNPTFTAPSVSIDTEYRVVLTVNDSNKDSKPDTVIITVSDVPLPPVANAGTDFNVNENETGTIDGSKSSDPEGLGLTYSWEIVPNDFTPDSPTSAKSDFTAPAVVADKEYQAILTVTNTVPLSDKDTVLVTVKDFNRKPVANAGTRQEVDENVEVTLNGTTSNDPDGDNITFKWIAPTGITLNDDTAEMPKFTSPAIHNDWIDYEFKLVVNDGKLDSDTDKVIVRVIHLNIAPTADAGTDFSIDENIQGQLDGSNSSDPEGKTLTYSWASPQNFVIDNPTQATSSFTAPEVQQNTVFEIVLTVNDGVRNDADTIVVTVNHINKKPVANAGPDQTVAENVLVQLDGSASADADSNDVITYYWVSYNGIVLNDNSAVKPTFTSPVLMKDSIFTFVLVLNDGNLSSDSSFVRITVAHTNLQPTAEAGVDITIDENVQGQLDASNSTDPEGKQLSYSWAAPSSFTIDNPNAKTTTFTAPEVHANTNFEIILEVNDEETTNNTDKDTIVVRVKQINKAPVANAGDDITTREQKTVQLNGSKSYDPDALDNISINWIAPAGIILDDATSPTPSFTAPAVSHNTKYVFNINVTDNLSEVGIDSVVVTVTPNQAPVANAGNAQITYSSQKVTLHGENSNDPDGDVITYEWVGPGNIVLTNPNSTNPVFTTPILEGDSVYTFNLKVTDELGLTNTASVEITVNGNRAPTVQSEYFIFVNEKDTVTLNASKSYDLDGDSILFSWSVLNEKYKSLIVFDDPTSPTPTIIIPKVDKNILVELTLEVSDSSLSSSIVVKLYIKDLQNKAPVANAGADIEIAEGTTINLDGTGSTDPEGDTIYYSWATQLSLDDTTSAIPELTAPFLSSDSLIMAVLTVSDGILESQSDTVWINVKNVNHAPVAYAGTNFTVDEGVEITFDGSVSNDPDGDILTFLWSGEGVTINSPELATTTITVPQVEKDTTVRIVLVVNDGNVNSTPDTIWVTIKQVNKLPVFVQVPAGNALFGYAYSDTIIVADSDLLDNITITANILPTWLNFYDLGNGMAIISTDSVPRDIANRVYNLNVVATDGHAVIDTTFAVNVNVKTGISDLWLNSVKIYPNPTKDFITIQFDKTPEPGTLIYIINQTGQIIFTKNRINQSTQINLSDNPAGLYYFKIISDSNVRTEKVILQ